MTQHDRQRARRAAMVRRDELSRDIARSDARPAERALMQQTLSHLWEFVEKACGAEESETERQLIEARTEIAAQKRQKLGWMDTAGRALAAIERVRERLKRGYVHTSAALLPMLELDSHASGVISAALLEQLEVFAQQLAPEHAAQLRAIVMRARGEL